MLLTPQSYRHLAHTSDCSASFGSLFLLLRSFSTVAAAQLMLGFDLGLHLH